MSSRTEVRNVRIRDASKAASRGTSALGEEAISGSLRKYRRESAHSLYWWNGFGLELFSKLGNLRLRQIPNLP